MNHLLAARSQMAMSLGFHIIFAAVGIALPLLMVIAEGLWLHKKDVLYRELAQRWSRGAGIFFAVGAVSGTALSFELGLLWPRFMAYAGPIIGMPFSLEGFAFFLEAIFLGVYLYGWEKVSPLIHWMSSVMVLASGTASGIFVVAANAWMNSPAGFKIVNGIPVHIRPFAAMLNPAFFGQSLHMIIAAFESVGFAVASLHAYSLLKKRRMSFHQRALVISLSVAASAALLEPLSGDFLARFVAQNQPVKLAAMEGQWETERGAPLRIGGWPDSKIEKTLWAIKIPKALSLLAYDNPNALVVGLKAFPSQDRPPVLPVHIAFQLMVACGSFLAGVALLGIVWTLRRGRLPLGKWFLLLITACGPLGFICIETGWIVTEVGRQPWIIYHVMRTAEAVTPMPGLTESFSVFTLIYIFLAVVVFLLLRKEVIEGDEREPLKVAGGRP